MTTASAFQPKSATITKALNALDSGLFTFNEQYELTECGPNINGEPTFTGDLLGLLLLSSCHTDELATYIDETNLTNIEVIVFDWAVEILELPEAAITDYCENYLETEENLRKKLTELDPHLASVGY